MATVKVRPEDVISVFPVEENKIYIREETGFYQKWRRYLNVLLIGIFILLPFVQYGGEQAILFDVGQQTFTFFAYVLYPQDLMIFALVFILAAFALFLVTRHYGRVWCGFTCPQTIWTLGFNWVERRIEGNHNQSRQLDSQAFNVKKATIKTAKHSVWIAISMLTATVFMSYFYPAITLYQELFTFSAPALITGWTLFFAGCTYINAGWIREKMCLHICPYSRFQAAMFDKNTSLVTYDSERGESRGPRKRNAERHGKGDCVDCKLCVQVCPAGIDIREGLQYACINCGLCVDACNKVMDKFNYKPNLIGFTRAGKDSGRHVTNWLYGVAIVVIVSAMFSWAYNRSDIEASIVRDRNVLYRENNAGHIENSYTLALLNKSRLTKVFELSIANSDSMTLSLTDPIIVLPGEKRMVTFSVEALIAPSKMQSEVEFAIRDKARDQTIIKPTLFFSSESLLKSKS